MKNRDHVHTIQLSRHEVIGTGQKIGNAYRLADGRVVIVTPKR